MNLFLPLARMASCFVLLVDLLVSSPRSQELILEKLERLTLRVRRRRRRITRHDVRLVYCKLMYCTLVLFQFTNCSHFSVVQM